MNITDLEARIRELERAIQQLEASLPAHSLSPSMLSRLETLEEELEKLQTIWKSRQSKPK